MRIKLLVSISGPEYSFAKNAIADTEVEAIDEAECNRLIAANYAEVIGSAPPARPRPPARPGPPAKPKSKSAAGRKGKK